MGRDEMVVEDSACLEVERWVVSERVRSPGAALYHILSLYCFSLSSYRIVASMSLHHRQLVSLPSSHRYS